METPPESLPPWVPIFVGKKFYDGGCAMKHQHFKYYNCSVFCIQCKLSFCKKDDVIRDHQSHGLVDVKRFTGEYGVIADNMHELFSTAGILCVYRSGYNIFHLAPSLVQYVPFPVTGVCICGSNLSPEATKLGYVFCTIMCKHLSLANTAYWKRCRLPLLIKDAMDSQSFASPERPLLDLNSEPPVAVPDWLDEFISLDHTKSIRVTSFCCACKGPCTASHRGEWIVQVKKLCSATNRFVVPETDLERVWDSSGIEPVSCFNSTCYHVQRTSFKLQEFPVESACICGAELRRMNEGYVYCSVACKKVSLEHPNYQRRCSLPQQLTRLRKECFSDEVTCDKAVPSRSEAQANMFPSFQPEQTRSHEVHSPENRARKRLEIDLNVALPGSDVEDLELYPDGRDSVQQQAAEPVEKEKAPTEKVSSSCEPAELSDSSDPGISVKAEKVSNLNSSVPAPVKTSTQKAPNSFTSNSSETASSSNLQSPAEIDRLRELVKDVHDSLLLLYILGQEILLKKRERKRKNRNS